MSGFKINFRLKPPERIVPFGKNRDHISWFGLTDGELWIEVGERTIYEYSDAAVREWGGVRYNDYYLSRFLEDFSEIFGALCEPVSKRLYDVVGSFAADADEWLGQHSDGSDEDFFRFEDEEYFPLTEWFYRRVFDSGHLTGGPFIGCFRCGDNVKIYWESDYKLENGESIWKYPSGIYELPYAEFAESVRGFLEEFYKEMDAQTELALQMDWGEVELDKDYLARENVERKCCFDSRLGLLFQPPSDRTGAADWNRAEALYDKMKSEINGGI